MRSTADLVALLDRLLGAGSEEVVPTARPVRRLGLALDHDASTAAWAAGEGLDALVLHRSWGFAAPAGLGVVACHEPFDQTLGLAHNRWLHAEIGLTGGADLAPKATVHAAPADVADRVVAAFGGRESLHEGAGCPIRRAVLADAMTDELVRRAAAAPAELYVTGSWRVPGAAAAQETGIAVLVVGHARQERWSLALLARVLAQAEPDVAVLTPSQP